MRGPPRQRGVRRPTVPVLMVALTLAAGSCSSGDESSDTATTSAPEGTTSTAAPGPSLPAAPAADESGHQTAPIGTNGINVDADGHLWIADGGGDQVVEVDPGTGEILARYPSQPGATPDDIAI